ncbi:MAG: hypothetical protein M3O31_07585 [Acidobacteriota bacterium]|nr:hypothetical protein [Acidobacteriota bacterium]
MKAVKKSMACTIGVLVCGGMLLAQAAPKHPMDAGFTKPAPEAQKLLEETLAKHPEVIVMMMHVQPPNRSRNVVIASSMGRIGEIGDEDDMRCIRTDKSNLEINTAGNHFEDELTLKDRSGRIIGALGLVFNYTGGDDKTKLVAIAEQIREELREQIPSKAFLFTTVN